MVDADNGAQADTSRVDRPLQHAGRAPRRPPELLERGGRGQVAAEAGPDA